MKSKDFSTGYYDSKADWRELKLKLKGVDETELQVNIDLTDSSQSYISIRSKEGFEAFNISPNKLRKLAKAILKETKQP